MRILVIGRRSKMIRELISQLPASEAVLIGFDRKISDIEPSKTKSFDALLVDVEATARTAGAAVTAISQQGVWQPTLLLGGGPLADNDPDSLFYSWAFDQDRRVISDWLNRAVTQSRSSPRTNVKFGEAVLNLEDSDVRVNGRRVELTSREFSTLVLLASAVNTPVCKLAIMMALYGKTAQLSPNLLEVYVSSLRRKLGEAGTRIETVGAAYRLIDNTVFAS